MLLNCSQMKSKGEQGERALNEWFHPQGLSYVHVDQRKETFAPLFRDCVKRPDFLVLLESIGLIAVDAKNYTLSRGEYTLRLEEEVRSVLAFERLFRIPMWYAYLSQENNQTWYWISALRSMEVGEAGVLLPLVPTPAAVRKLRARGKSWSQVAKALGCTVATARRRAVA